MYNDYFLTSDYVDTVYQSFVAPVVSTTVVVGAAPPVTTINGGGGGQVVGPNVTVSGGSTGLDFTGTGNQLVLSGTLAIANGGTGAVTAATARGNLGAAKSGVNDDITMFTALAGSGGWAAWTGNSDKAAHATFSGTASVGYVQAELQAVMDKLKEQTEAFKALLDTLLASGAIKL